VEEQVARQQIGQHWSITLYIAVYIQGLYTVYNGTGVRSTVAVLGLVTNQGRRQPPQYKHFSYKYFARVYLHV
jgi:hypothetical protein